MEKSGEFNPKQQTISLTLSANGGIRSFLNSKVGLWRTIDFTVLGNVSVVLSDQRSLRIIVSVFVNSSRILCGSSIIEIGLVLSKRIAS